MADHRPPLFPDLSEALSEGAATPPRPDPAAVLPAAAAIPRWIEPVRVATSDAWLPSFPVGSPSFIDGVVLDHLDRVLVTDGAEPGLYEYRRSPRDGPWRLVRLPPQQQLLDRVLAVFVAEGNTFADCAFSHDPEGDGRWVQIGNGPIAVHASVTAEAPLDDVQRAAENWTPEAVARFLAVLHHRRHHKDEDEEKDGGTFSVKLDQAIQEDDWEPAE